MLKRLSNYLNDQKRWNESGHAFFGFVMGSLNPIIMILWVGFVFYQELIIDGHWNFWREDENSRLDFLFDLQSKLIPAVFSYFLFNIVYGVNVNVVYSLICFIIIFFFGYKGSWFYDKKITK